LVEENKIPEYFGCALRQIFRRKVVTSSTMTAGAHTPPNISHSGMDRATVSSQKQSEAGDAKTQP
jgi:hypothetical protein